MSLRSLAVRFAALASAALVLAAFASVAFAQAPDPAQLLADAKAATGGAAWDALRSQHSIVRFKAGDQEGVVERWASLTTGRSLLRYEIGAASGMQGFDGLGAWSQDGSEDTHVDNDDDTRELAVNAAYRDRLAFWYPDRQPARFEYARRDSADGIDYDVVRITPDGGRAYEVWIGMLTHRIERLVENEGSRVRTDVYGDFRAVQGVTLPFRVRTTRGDPRNDEEYTIEKIEYNVALDDVDFSAPPPAADDVAFVQGRDAVDVPFVVRNGHLFVDVKLDGKGPFRMLFDAGGASVLMPSAVKALGLTTVAGEGGVDAVGIDRVDVGGVVFARQTFAAIDLAGLMRRVEGVDDVAGILGHDIVRRLPVRIDYEHSKLTLYRRGAYKPASGAVRVPVALDGTLPRVHARVDGIDGAFIVDTGSRASLTLAAPFVGSHDLVAKYGATVEVVAGAGAAGHPRAMLARAGRLSIAAIDVDAPVTYLATAASGAPGPDVDGHIGYGVLRRLNVTFDLARKALYLEKNAQFGERDVHERAGVWLERGEHGFDVVDVVAGGPAQHAGLAAGDVIVAVDGKPAKSMTLADVRTLLRGPAGTKVRLKPERKGAKDAVVVLRDLI